MAFLPRDLLFATFLSATCFRIHVLELGKLHVSQILESVPLKIVNRKNGTVTKLSPVSVRG